MRERKGVNNVEKLKSATDVFDLCDAVYVFVCACVAQEG